MDVGIHLEESLVFFSCTTDPELCAFSRRPLVLLKNSLRLCLEASSSALEEVESLLRVMGGELLLFASLEPSFKIAPFIVDARPFLERLPLDPFFSALLLPLAILSPRAGADPRFAESLG